MGAARSNRLKAFAAAAERAPACDEAPASAARQSIAGRPAVAPLSGAVRALCRPWMLAAVWLVALGYALRFVLYRLPAPPEFTDFNHFYIAAEALAAGANPYVTSLASLRTFGLDIGPIRIENQTPTTLVLFEPFTKLDPRTAYWVWVSICAALLLLTLGMLLRASALDTRQRMLFAAMILLYPAVYEHFCFANLQIVTMALAVIGIFSLESGADGWAGASLALAVALKGYPIFIAIYLICRARWRALVWMMVWGGIIGSLTLWQAGWPALSFFDTFDFTTSRKFLENAGFVSLDAIVSRLFWADHATLNASADLMRRIAIGTAEAAVVCLTIAATLRAASVARDLRALSLWIPAMILLSPVAEPQYLVMLMVPFAAIADGAARGAAEPRAIYAALGSYALAFARYPLALLHHVTAGAAGFFHVADQFWSFALILAYLAMYWLVTSAPVAADESARCAPAAACAVR